MEHAPRKRQVRRPGSTPASGGWPRHGRQDVETCRETRKAVGDFVSPTAFSITTIRPRPDGSPTQPALQQGSAEQAGSSQQLAQPPALAPWWARRPENRPRRARRWVGALAQQAGSAPQAGSAAAQAGAAAQPGSAAEQAGSEAQSQLERPRRPAAEAVSETIKLTARAHRTATNVGRRNIRFSS